MSNAVRLPRATFVDLISACRSHIYPRRALELHSLESRARYFNDLAAFRREHGPIDRNVLWNSYICWASGTDTLSRVLSFYLLTFYVV